jgi:hypothetical protein
MLARLATDVLARERVSETEVSADREQRAIGAMEHAIVNARQRRRMRVVGAGIVVAAAAAAAFFALRPSAPAPVATITPPAPFEISVTGNAAQTGDRVVTHDGRAVYALSTGTRVSVEPNGDVDLGITPSAQRFTLRSGSLHADVAKLVTGQRFLVTTADAEIEVRGTSFTVAVSDHPTCGTLTSVAVTEGTVWVRFHGTESVLVAGASWPPPCTAALPVTPATTQKPASVAIAPAVTHAAPSPSLSPAPSPAMETSFLGEQNRIFEDAIAAKRRGDVAGALAGFDRLTDGPLAESAAAERMRLLAGAHDARARAAAEQYLSRYPNGFAAGEARAITSP